MGLSKMTIPFFDLGTLIREEREELHKCLDDVIESGFFVGGPLTEKFEREFAFRVGTEYCVGVANGLDAIRLILEAHDIGEGDEVIVPAFTYYATWLGVTQTGATPVPVDVQLQTANVDPDQIRAAITPRTKAIIAVHLFGQAADMAALATIARDHNLWLFEDAAQGHDAYSTNGRVGNAGDAGAFSFYPTKNLGALGDAGGITTNNPEIAARIRSRRSYGQGSSKYDHVDTGWNSRLDPIQAAFLSLHLSKLEAWTKRRRDIAHLYGEALGENLISAIGPFSPMESVWHHFVLRASRREELQDFLQLHDVTTDAHYPYAVTDLAPMKKLMTKNSLKAKFPQAERLAKEVVSLPMGPWMSDSQVSHVTSVLRQIPTKLLSN